MNKIFFYPTDKDTELSVLPPVPAKESVPKWYKDKKFFEGNGGKPLIDDGEIANISAKGCVPFFDALTSGYILKTWCDIYIEADEVGVNYHYARLPEIMSHRQTVALPIDRQEFYDIEFIWKVRWLPRLPKGYSLLITHPMNRFDLPFVSVSGIIDADVFYHSYQETNFPFYIKKGFSGIIPTGTPIMQMIPIKRDSWKKELEKYDEKELMQKKSIAYSSFWGSYKKLFHQKKKYI